MGLGTLLRVTRPLCGLLLYLRRIPSPIAFQPPQTLRK